MDMISGLGTELEIWGCSKLRSEQKIGENIDVKKYIWWTKSDKISKIKIERII